MGHCNLLVKENKKGINKRFEEEKATWRWVILYWPTALRITAHIVEHESRMIRSKGKNKKKFDQFESRVVEDVH